MIKNKFVSSHFTVHNKQWAIIIHQILSLQNRLRIIQAKKFNRPINKPVNDPDNNSSIVGEGEDSNLQNVSVASKNGSDEEEEKDESGNESDEHNETGTTVPMSEDVRTHRLQSNL